MKKPCEFCGRERDDSIGDYYTHAVCKQDNLRDKIRVAEQALERLRRELEIALIVD